MTAITAAVTEAAVSQTLVMIDKIEIITLNKDDTIKIDFETETEVETETVDKEEVILYTFEVMYIIKEYIFKCEIAV